MSNSELIDCTRESEKLRMREIECSGGGETDKKDHRLHEREV